MLYILLRNKWKFHALVIFGSCFFAFSFQYYIFILDTFTDKKPMCMVCTSFSLSFPINAETQNRLVLYIIKAIYEYPPLHTLSFPLCSLTCSPGKSGPVGQKPSASPPRRDFSVCLWLAPTAHPSSASPSATCQIHSTDMCTHTHTHTCTVLNNRTHCCS